MICMCMYIFLFCGDEGSSSPTLSLIVDSEHEDEILEQKSTWSIPNAAGYNYTFNIIEYYSRYSFVLKSIWNFDEVIHF